MIISVENLGKCYAIRHQRERYTALRDVIAEKTTGFFKKLKTEKLKAGNGETESRPTSDLSVSASQNFSVSRASTEEFWALRGIDFEVKRGEVLGIIGRNGAGKTTLLKILSRITEPTEGKVRIKGRVASLLEVGTGFHPELTGRENIYLNGAILGMTKAEITRKFDEIVAFAETEKFLDTPVKRYSSGMYVRLAFAVAAHLEPEILVVDEVLAVGDAEFQKKCLGKMESVATREGRTVLFVSHNMTAVQALCSTAILLHQGKLEKMGSVSDVAGHYMNSVSQTASVVLEHSGQKPIKITRALIESVRCAENTRVCLVVDISAKVEKRCSIECRVRDQYGAPIGLASLGLLDTSQRLPLTEGVQRYLCELRLPRLARGNYSIDIQIADPMVEIFDALPTALTFDVIPEPISGSRNPLESSWGYGPSEIPLKVSAME
jgi:lipopolysaccharide transport system ATP-binding protein